MAGLQNSYTLEGNLTGDPELRFTAAGVAVANFTIAHTPRKLDKATNEWSDGETLFMRGTVWREQAENVAETLGKGMRVLAVGSLKQRKYTPTNGGEERTVIEMEVDVITPVLTYATAKVTKTARREGQGGGQQNGGQQRSQNGGQQGGQPDPWASAPVSTPGGNGGGWSDEPPF